MKLTQGQLWKQGREYIRIVKLDRLAVEYKSMTSVDARDGSLIQTTKKDFCRLLKGAHLLAVAKKAGPAPGEFGSAETAQ